MRDLIFPFVQKPWQEKLDDGDIGKEVVQLIEKDTRIDSKYTTELLNLRAKAEFLQKKVPAIYDARN